MLNPNTGQPLNDNQRWAVTVNVANELVAHVKAMLAETELRKFLGRRL